MSDEKLVDRELTNGLATDIRAEAEWVTAELAEVVKQIQHLRTIYLTAVFVLSGWILSRLLAGAGQTNQDLAVLQHRTDIVVIVSLLPLVNILFFLLLLQANSEMNSLANYRRVLGNKLGSGTQVWRWPDWRSSRRGPLAWAGVVNFGYGLTALLLSALAFKVSFDALEAPTSTFLPMMLRVVAFITGLLVLIAIGIGLRHLQTRNNEQPLPLWDELPSQPNRPPGARSPTIRRRALVLAATFIAAVTVGVLLRVTKADSIRAGAAIGLLSGVLVASASFAYTHAFEPKTWPAYGRQLVIFLLSFILGGALLVLLVR